MQDSAPHLGECCIQVPPQDKVEGLGLHSGVTDIEISMCVGGQCLSSNEICVLSKLSVTFSLLAVKPVFYFISGRLSVMVAAWVLV